MGLADVRGQFVLAAKSIRNAFATAMLLAGATAILTIDLLHPPEVVVASAYVVIVVAAFSQLGVRAALALTAATSLATVAAGLSLPASTSLHEQAVERGLAIVLQWLVAYIMLRRSRALSTLSQSEARYNALFNGAADGILTVDADGTILSINHAAERALGYEPGELIGQPLEIIIPPDYREHHRRQMQEYVAGRLDIAHLIGVTREVEAQSKDGTVFPIEINVSRINCKQCNQFSAVIRDITERKNAERQLRENQRTLSTLLSNLPGMAYRCQFDLTWTMLFVSQGSVAITGYEPHELIGNKSISYESVIYPADRMTVFETITRCVKSDQPFNLSYRIVHKSGDIRWVNERGAAVKGHDGRVVCLEGFISDVTREKKVEESLRESESRFRSIADTTPFMIWASGLDMGITFANARVTEYFGVTIDEMLGDGWLRIVHDTDRDAVVAEYKRAFENWKPFEMEYRVRRADGQWRWLRVHGIPRFAPDGDFMGFLGSAIDMHDRKVAELALRETELRFQRIADSSPMMVWLADESGQCTFVNKTWTDFTGRALEHELGTGWLERIHPDDRDRVGKQFLKSVAQRTPYTGDYRLLRHDGQYRWILDQGAPVFAENGEFRGYSGSCFDFTDRWEAIEALRESESRFREMADQIPAVMWMSNPDGPECTFINRMWEVLTGQPTDSALGDGWLQCVHPDDRKGTRALVLNAVADRIPYEHEFRVRGTDGRWHILMNRGIPRSSPNGSFNGYAGVAIDITQQRQADRVIWQIASGVSAQTGEEFFRSLAMQLSEALDADFASIGELLTDGSNRMQTIAVVKDGQVADDIVYDLVGTPCAAALADDSYACLAGVQGHFPTDAYLSENGIESYIGQSLKDSHGRVCGILWVLFRRPLEDVSLALSLLRIFAARAAAELIQRQTNNELRLSEERFRLAVRAGNFILFRQDRDLRYTWIHNPAGLDNSDVVGRTDHELLPADEADLLTRIKREVIKTANSARAEVELSPGGVKRFFDLIVDPIFDDSGNVAGITCVSVDISERKQMEMALRESEFRFRRLFEEAPIAMIEYDLSSVRSALQMLADRGIRDVATYLSGHPEDCARLMLGIQNVSLNRSALGMLGVGSFDELKVRASELTDRSALAPFIKFITSLWNGCTAFEDEAELRVVGGITRNVIANSMIVPGHESTWSRVVTSMVDVTAQHRAEEALRMSETKFRTMFHESPMAKMEVDFSRVKLELSLATHNGRISLTEALAADANLLVRCMQQIVFTSVNDTAVSVFHAGSAEMLKTNIPQLFTDGTRAAFVEFLDRMWRGEKTYQVETDFRTLNGQVRVGRVHCVLTTDSNADWSQVLVAILDITDSRHAEEELSRAKRLETAGRLAGQIAHDFNNLLGPLVAYPEILQAKFPEEGRAHEMLRDMQQAALQIAEINQELLTLSRRGHYNTEPLDLNALVESAIRAASPPPTVTVETRLAPDELIIRGGGAQLMRALLNIVKNAIEAMDEVGILTIVSDRIYLDETVRRFSTIERGEYACIRIQDSGCGIPEDALPHIFEPFFTTKKTDRRRGSGLGLPVVHSVIEDHEGHIGIESAPGKGTTFTLYFPLYRGESKACADSGTLEPGHGEHVLVIDDDPLQRRIAQTALERVGFRVTVMESGEDALRFITDHPVDLAIIDMIMGGIDGAETLRRIREMYPGQPALILTGYSTSERAQAALRLGHCEILAKPIQASTLTRAIHRALDAAGSESVQELSS